MRNARAACLGLMCFGALSAFAQVASATVQSVNYGNLVASATVATPLDVGDTLFLNTFTTELGHLDEMTTFTVGPDVGSFVGRAVWEVGGANEPNLSGVNIKILDASNINNVVADDSIVLPSVAGFVHSTFGPGAALAPGKYILEATGTGGGAGSSLDISLTFAQAIPEAGTFSMLAAGLGALGFLARRRLMM